MGAVRIGEPGSGWLGFDLREVLAAVGPQADLAWLLEDAEFNGEVAAVWPEGREPEPAPPIRHGS